ncbi:MAG: DUF4143 domain-containing protein [Trueperaceae bacterium]|nr:DUF4143 domain-containing protein [Trueperaceae bacterium]
MSVLSDGPPSGSRPTPRQQVYRPRVVDQELHDRLRSRGTVVIEGAKACGKTATAMQRAASVVRLDVDAGARRAAEIDAALVLNGSTPRLLGEWQTVPTLWNHVRRAVDDRALPGQFILTGSATPADDITRHTGAGRLSRLRMRTMSCFETGHATGMVSLQALFGGEPARSPETALTVPDIAMRVAVGGWPGHLALPDRDAVRAANDYLQELHRSEIQRLDEGRRDPLRVAALLRAVARHVAEPAPKRHFVDPSLAAAALGATPPRLLRDVGTLGLLFESLVVRDLRVYAQPFEATVLHYRDNTRLEVDAIVETSDGAWAAFEIKLGHARLDEAAANLLKFADRVDDRRTGQRARLVVITGTGYAYDRPDGVAVVPIGALGP